MYTPLQQDILRLLAELSSSPANASIEASKAADQPAGCCPEACIAPVAAAAAAMAPALGSGSVLLISAVRASKRSMLNMVGVGGCVCSCQSVARSGWLLRGLGWLAFRGSSSRLGEPTLTDLVPL